MLRSCSFTAASEICRLMLFAKAADLQVFLHMQLICRNGSLSLSCPHNSKRMSVSAQMLLRALTTLLRALIRPVLRALMNPVSRALKRPVLRAQLRGRGRGVGHLAARQPQGAGGFPAAPCGRVRGRGRQRRRRHHAAPHPRPGALPPLFLCGRSWAQTRTRTRDQQARDWH